MAVAARKATDSVTSDAEPGTVPTSTTISVNPDIVYENDDEDVPPSLSPSSNRIAMDSRALDKELKYFRTQTATVDRLRSQYQASARDSERKAIYQTFETVSNEFRQRFQESYDRFVRKNDLL